MHGLDTKNEKKKKMKRRLVKKKRSNCNYPSIFVNMGTNPRVLCWFLSQSMLRSSTVNFSSVKFLCRSIINFLFLVGNSKRKNMYIYISGLYFPKNAPNFSFQKYLLGVLSPLKKKKNTHFFFVYPQFSISKHPWGRGTAILWLFIYVRTH